MILPNTAGCEHDPVTLVNRLTQGKISQKERFDVIFTWVARNIRYDYATYLSPHGSQLPRIKHILKFKKGICLDYAYLMDSMCTLAGIENMSVYGYAKDDLFDVTDSIFMDNHAWNAVKLDNKWYLYDVTWASGHYSRELRTISRWIVNWQDRIIRKRINKTITYRKPLFTECDTIKSYKQTFETLPRRYKILLNILQLLPLHAKLHFNKVVHPEFYLANPETFAITHFPDNPYWSLTDDYKMMRDFETDSAFYHLNDTVYAIQKREGRPCTECDNYFSLDEMSKQREMKSNSYDFNKKNRFVPFLCNYTIAGIFYEQSLPETDSLTKISLIDSALTYLADAKTDLQQSLRYVNKEIALQRAKNKQKMQVLYDENKESLNFIHSIITATFKQTIKMAKFKQSNRVASRKLKLRKKKLYEVGQVNPKAAGFKTKEIIQGIKLKLEKEAAKADSLNNVITVLTNSYNATVINLSDHLWKKIEFQDSLSKPFFNGIPSRKYYLLDNYKKVIVEERKKIKKYENLFGLNISDSIFALSDSCSDKGLQIFDLFEKRNALFVESTKLMTALVNIHALSADTLKNYIEICAGKIQENNCWIIGGSSKLKSVLAGYKAFINTQKENQKLIRAEKRAEYKRYREVNGEILRRQIKFKNIPANNLRVTSNKRSIVKANKRAYLKSLKDARKKAREQAKKEKN